MEKKTKSSIQNLPLQVNYSKSRSDAFLVSVTWPTERSTKTKAYTPFQWKSAWLKVGNSKQCGVCRNQIQYWDYNFTNCKLADHWFPARDIKWILNGNHTHWKALSSFFVHSWEAELKLSSAKFPPVVFLWTFRASSNDIEGKTILPQQPTKQLLRS